VFPYRFLANGHSEYAIFKRADSAVEFWKGIASGGEESETLLEAAKREAYEERGMTPEPSYITLDSAATIPVEGVSGFLLGEDVLYQSTALAWRSKIRRSGYPMNILNSDESAIIPQ
jgi:dATP pyrophosphohydrolase